MSRLVASKPSSSKVSTASSNESLHIPIIEFEPKSLISKRIIGPRIELLTGYKAALEDVLSDNAGVTKEDFKEAVNTTISELNVSISTLVNDLGVTQGTISRWRHGKCIPTPIARKAVLLQSLEYTLALIASARASVDIKGHKIVG